MKESTGLAVPLREARDAKRFGRKAAQLASASRARLPIPAGFALPTDLVEALALREPAAERTLRSCLLALDAPVALRSSCVADEGSGDVFAGVRASALNVVSPAAALAAAPAVIDAVRGRRALSYRRALGLAAEPRLGLLVQELVDARCGGTLWSPGAEGGARVEAVWGPGGAIARGLAEPDRVRFDAGGSIAEQRVGVKRRRIRFPLRGGSEEVEVPREAVRAPCLDANLLEALFELALRSEALFGAPQRIEWARGIDALWLIGSSSV